MSKSQKENIFKVRENGMTCWSSQGSGSFAQKWSASTRRSEMFACRSSRIAWVLVMRRVVRPMRRRMIDEEEDEENEEADEDEV